MKTILSLLFFSVTTLLLADEAKPVPRLTIELRDGSRVVGQSVDSQIKLHSALLGDLKLPVSEICAIEFTKTNCAKLTAANGDVLMVQMAETEIPVRTSFGKVELAVAAIRSLRVSETVSLNEFFQENGIDPKPPFHVAYIVPAGTVGNQHLRPEEAQTMGNDFDVNTPVKITALGVFDSEGNGLAGRLHARIYDRDSRASLADIEFTPENSGTLVGGSRFLALKNPLVLKAGFHGIISVAYLGNTTLEPNGNVRVSPGNWTTDSGDGAISFVGMGAHTRGGAGDFFPDIEDPSPVPNTFAAGTFVFSRAPAN